ncbi:MAG: hypothetical protein WAT19_11765 [Ferruginibacter sp.]
MKRIQIFLLIIFSLHLSTGCKKETVPEVGPASATAPGNAVENLKTFYQNTLAAAQTASLEENPIQRYTSDSIEWERTSYFPEQKTYIVPVFFLKTKLNGLYRTFKFLVFTDQGASYSGYSNTVIAGKDVPHEGFDEKRAMAEVITDLQSGSTAGVRHVKYSLDYSEPLNKEHRFAVKEETPQTSLQGIPQSNYVDPSEECQDNGGTMITIDWYWQTYVNGVLVYEEYLYSTQECSVVLAGGGGGGTGSYCGQQAASFVNAGQVSSQAISGVEESNNGTIKIDKYTWKIYDAVTWFLYSCDKLKWYRPNANTAYTFYGFEHMYITESGMSIGGTRTYKLLSPPTARSYVSSAVVSVDFSVTHSIVCQGFPLSATINHTASKKFKPYGVTVVSQ